MTCDVDKHFHLGKEETSIVIALINDKLSKQFELRNNEIIIHENINYINSFPETLLSFLTPLTNLVNLYEELCNHYEDLEG